MYLPVHEENNCGLELKFSLKYLYSNFPILWNEMLMTFDSTTVIWRDLVHAIRKRWPEKKTHFLLHRDNAPAHLAKSAINNLDMLGFDHVNHAQYSPDLAPMDLKVFQTVKAELRGKNWEHGRISLCYLNNCKQTLWQVVQRCV